MATEYEFEGKTKDEALKKACKKLGLTQDQMEVEVVSYGSSGIFGLVGVKKAKIKVSVPGTVESDPVESDPVKPDTVKPEPAEAASTEASPPTEMEADNQEDLAEKTKAILETMVSFIVEDAVVKVKQNSDRVKLTVEGGNSALLIGKHGRTLDALQYIVQKSVQKKGVGKTRITVDVEGYRDRRKASLTQLALRMGEKVKRSGKPATINPMNAYDRRIVHVALKDETKVRTQSIGSGALRKLVIFPQRKKNSKQRQREAK